jgi:hypothetical protein
MSPRVARLVTLLLALGMLGDVSLASAQSSKKRHKSSPAAAPAPPAADSSKDELGDLDSEPKAAVVDSAVPSSDDKRPAGEEAPAPVAEPSESPEPEPAPAAPAPVVASGPDVLATPFAGLGMGTRSFRRPTMQGGQQMGDQPLFAADVGIAFHAWPKDAFSWIFLWRYQTSINFQVKETPPFALPNYVNVRSDRVELSAAPTFRFGDAATAPRLAIPIGMELRTFWPDVHNLMTPRYIFFGPHARAELQLNFTEALSLRVAPELQWIVYFSKELTNNGVKPMGIAVGGEVSLRLALGAVFALDLSYRQSNAMANSAYGQTFRDLERYLTLRLLGTL